MAALGVAFALPREKPAWIFALGFGSVLGAVSLYLAGLLRVRLSVWNVSVVGFCATVGVWSALLISITQHYRRELPKSDLVQKMLQQFPGDTWENGALPRTTSWPDYVKYFLRQRVSDHDPVRSLWLWLFLAEGALAGVMAMGVLSVSRFRKSRSPAGLEATP